MWSYWTDILWPCEFLLYYLEINMSEPMGVETSLHRAINTIVKSNNWVAILFEIRDLPSPLRSESSEFCTCPCRILRHIPLGRRHNLGAASTVWRMESTSKTREKMSVAACHPHKMRYFTKEFSSPWNFHEEIPETHKRLSISPKSRPWNSTKKSKNRLRISPKHHLHTWRSHDSQASWGHQQSWNSLAIFTWGTSWGTALSQKISRRKIPGRWYR